MLEKFLGKHVRIRKPDGWVVYAHVIDFDGKFVTLKYRDNREVVFSVDVISAIEECEVKQ